MNTRILPLLTALILAILTACVRDVHTTTADDGAIALVGQTLPQFEVTTTDGSRVSTPQLAGRPSVIVLFHTDCSDCRRELPTLQRLYGEYAPRATFLCISRAEGTDSVTGYWQENGLTLPVSAQADRSVYALFARHTIPRVYVADASLRIRSAFATRASEKDLRAAIEATMQ